MSIAVGDGKVSTPFLSPEVLTCVEQHGSLSSGIAWVSESHATRQLAGSVAQDEFTYDIVLQISADLCLMYDVT